MSSDDGAKMPRAEITPVNEALWARLDQGELVYQRCVDCQHAWLPPREECPECLSDRWEHIPSTGRARLISWVIFHRAYHPYFAEKLPYNVALVELAEGPRMLTNIVETPTMDLRIDLDLELCIEEEEGQALARFRPTAS